MRLLRPVIASLLAFQFFAGQTFAQTVTGTTTIHGLSVPSRVSPTDEVAVDSYNTAPGGRTTARATLQQVVGAGLRPAQPGVLGGIVPGTGITVNPTTGVASVTLPGGIVSDGGAATAAAAAQAAAAAATAAAALATANAAVPANTVGVPLGVAGLDATGKVSTSALPTGTVTDGGAAASSAQSTASAAQATANAAAPKASPTFTGTVTVPTFVVTGTASIPGYATSASVPVNVSQLANDAGYVNAAAAAAAAPVRTVNGGTGAVVITPGSIGAATVASVPTNTNQLTNGSGFVNTAAAAAAAPVQSVNGTTGAVSITPASIGAATVASVPTRTSQITNDSITPAAIGAATTATPVNSFAAPTAPINAGGFALNHVGTPSASDDGAPKSYVDSVAAGLTPKPIANAATAAALPTNTYSNGSSGVGATLTATAVGVLTVDGVALTAGNLVLVQNEAVASHNGLYDVTTAGTASVAYVLTRDTAMDQPNEFNGTVPVAAGGTVNAKTSFLCDPVGTVVVGTTAIPFVSQGGNGVVAGNGINAAGSTISVAPASGGGLAVTGSGVGIANLGAANGVTTNDSTGHVAASQVPAFTGDVSSSAGTTALTLPTVNSTPGTCIKATANGKGLTTACAPLSTGDLPSGTVTDGGAASAAAASAAAAAQTTANAAAVKANNGSDFPNPAAFRTNIGLGGAATLSVGTGAGTVAAGNDSRIVGAAPAASPTFTGTATVSGTAVLAAGQVYAIRTVTSSAGLPVTLADYIVVINQTTAGPITVALPSSPATGQAILIKDGKGDSATNAITVTGGGSNIDNAASSTVSGGYISVTFVYDGAQWRRI